MSTMILAIDLGKFKSVACVYEASDGQHRFETVETTPARFHDLIVEHVPFGRVALGNCLPRAPTDPYVRD